MNKTKSRLQINRNRFMWSIVCIVMSAILVLLNRGGRLNQQLSLVVLAVGIISVYKSRKNWYLLIIEITVLFCNYSIVGPNYLFTLNTSFTELSSDPSGVLGLNILLLFSVFNYIFAPVVAKRNHEEPIIIEGRYNPVIILGFLVILALIWVFGFKRPTTIGGRGTPSAIYEYSIVFIIIGYYYCGNKLWAKIAITIATTMFALQNFVFGGRITGIQLVLCIVMCLFIDKISIKKVVVASAIGIPIMTGIGSDRGSFALTISSFANSIHNILTGKLTLDTAYSAYYTSLTFLKYKENTSFGERMYMFRQFILSLILGGSVKDSSLPDITRTQYMHYWGGGNTILCIFLPWIVRCNTD